VGIGTDNPLHTLHVNGDAQIGTINTGSNATSLCFDNADGYIIRCSSLRSLKENINPLSLGLNTIMQLNPVTFDWKSSHVHDLGFIAEEVELVNPLLAEHDKNGNLTGVKSALLTSLLTKGVQELNTKFENLRNDPDLFVTNSGRKD
ncbi:MAG: tail fiber domain-containing protein, partial [Candidatus Levybacteria bacterium]|nr:tail fiber domain-containing protein [Candidatus Levybacteria bacterium]